MKKWLDGVLFASIVLLLVLVVQKKRKLRTNEVDDTVSKDNPSGDLAPLEKKVKVVIAEDGAASGAGFYIAKEKGYFEDYNIEVEFAYSQIVMKCCQH